MTITFENIPGTLGQCVMLPPETDNPEKLPAVPYHLGGGLFNILAVLVAGPLCLLIDNMYGKAFFLILSVLSLAFAMLNLFPAKVVAPNDGYNIKLALKSAADRKAMYHMLQIMAGTELSYAEMPESYFEISDGGEYLGTMKLMNAYRFLDNGDMDKAEELFKEVFIETQDTAEYYRMEAGKELLFCMLLRKAPADSISKVYNDELKKYLNDKKNQSASSHRVLCAYDCLMVMDDEKAREEFNKAMKKLKFLSPGELKMEKRLLDKVMTL